MNTGKNKNHADLLFHIKSPKHSLFYSIYFANLQYTYDYYGNVLGGTWVGLGGGGGGGEVELLGGKLSCWGGGGGGGGKLPLHPPPLLTLPTAGVLTWD